MNFSFRSLKESDFNRGILPLLAQLTTTGDLTEEIFAKYLRQLSQNSHHRTLVAEDLGGKLIAHGTLLIEPKLIHGGRSVGHIEDIVVDSAYRQQGLGSQLVSLLVEQAREAGCYKVILDCNENAENFYRESGFTRVGLEMACYFDNSQHSREITLYQQEKQANPPHKL